MTFDYPYTLDNPYAPPAAALAPSMAGGAEDTDGEGSGGDEEGRMGWALGQGDLPVRGWPAPTPDMWSPFSSSNRWVRCVRAVRAHVCACYVCMHDACTRLLTLALGGGGRTGPRRALPRVPRLPPVRRDYVRVAGPGVYVGCGYRRGPSGQFSKDDCMYFLLVRHEAAP